MLDVRPVLAHANGGNRSLRDAEPLSKRASRLLGDPNLSHLLICELRRVAASLLDLIAHVVAWRSEEQMLIVDAGWIIAGVAEENTRRNWSPFMLPRQPMRTLESSLPHQQAIASIIRGPAPFNASRGMDWCRMEGKAFGEAPISVDAASRVLHDKTKHTIALAGVHP